jgi:hypothetical protein
MWERVIVSVWGSTINCEGEWDSGSNGKGGVSQKYQEVLERQKKAILSQASTSTSTSGNPEIHHTTP